MGINMQKIRFWSLIFLSFFYIENISAEVKIFGLQCSGTETAEIKSCLKKEANKIDEANLPNEIIISNNREGIESLLKLVTSIIEAKNNNTAYKEKLIRLLPSIEASVATAIIIQYEVEPQLYYYIIDKNGKLEVIIDGMNSVDISETHKEIFNNDTDVFYLKSPNTSAIFLEWLISLKK
jgi:hypothetical protein